MAAGSTGGFAVSKRVEIAERLKSMGIDPVEGMARIAMQAERNGNLPLAGKMYAELLQYCAPKLKSIEHSISPDTQLFLERQQRLAQIKELLTRLSPTLVAENIIEGETVPVLKHNPDEA